MREALEVDAVVEVEALRGLRISAFAFDLLLLMILVLVFVAECRRGALNLDRSHAVDKSWLY